MTELTTLQLAEKIAQAVIDTYTHGDPEGVTPAQSVLFTLHECSSWFCRVVQDEHGVIDGTQPITKYPVQQDLFT